MTPDARSVLERIASADIRKCNAGWLQAMAVEWLNASPPFVPSPGCAMCSAAVASPNRFCSATCARGYEANPRVLEHERAAILAEIDNQ